MDQKEQITIAYDAQRGVFVDQMDQMYGAQEYIDQHLGHVIFNDFDIKKIEGYQAKDYIFSNHSKEYHIYVDDRDLEMIKLLTSYQRKNGRLKIKTSKDIKQKLKKGYVIAGIVSTMVVSGISYLAGSGMLGDAVGNVQNYIEEVQEEKEAYATKEKVAPVLNYLIQERENMLQQGTLSLSQNEAYNKSNEFLYETAINIYLELESTYPQDEIDNMLSGGVLRENGKLIVKQYMQDLLKEQDMTIDIKAQR